jgi:hypothetical protein
LVISMRKFVRSQQGNAILFVAIALAVLALIGVAAVEFTGRDLGASRQHQRASSIERCALSARSWILSQSSSGVTTVPPGSTLRVNMDSQGDTVTMVADAHVDGTLDAKPRIPPAPLGGIAAQLSDMTGRIRAQKGLGGGIYTAICSDSDVRWADGGGGRTFEVEFAFQSNQ